MSQINTSQTIFLNTTLSGGVQPYDPCATWTGNYIAGNGTTGDIPVNFQSVGTPYIETEGPCVLQGPSRGSLTGKFYPNGFTGTVNFWTTAKDASGITDESNQLSYTVVALSALTVNAGPDQFVNGNPPPILLNGASVSGGGGSYTYSWSQSFSNPALTYFNNALTLNPSPVTGASSNGAYTYTLTATDTVTGLTGSDSVVINVTGNTPPNPNPYGTFSVFNQSGATISGTWQVYINSVPYNDFSTGFATILNNTTAQLPLNNNFFPPRSGTFVIQFTPGSGINTSKKATLIGGSSTSVGPVNFVLNAGKYEATISVAPAVWQFNYSIQITN
jgi:hypothetical protein